MKDNFESALQLAMNAHAGQLDNGWTPYIMHLLGVWSRVREESLTTQIVALLHDSVEDTDTSMTNIYDHFGTDVGHAVLNLTHPDDLPYNLYIERIAQSKNRAAILVKLADLADNSSEFRLQRLPESKREYFKKRTQEKYTPARARLLQALKELDAQ